jgi:CRP-like cAMP-binding protein/CheY-like chemotaxis protein
MKNILIIDSDAIMGDHTREVLELANYSVSTARNRNEGIQMALRYSPDYIICDAILPDQEGYGVLQLIQSNNQVKHIPFISLSLNTNNMQFSSNLRMELADDISKSYKKGKLIQVIEDMFAKAERFIHSGSEQASIKDSIPVAFSETESTEHQLLKTIEQIADTAIFKKKQIIYLDGQRAHHLYYIKKGKIKAFKNNEDGKELITGIYGEGDFLGHVALLADTAHNHSAKAMDNSELLIISKKEFDSMIFHNPHIIAHFISLMIKGLIEKDKQLLGVAYNSLRKKVADTLLVVSEKYKTSIITLSRENLASLAGTATASLIRMLSELKDENIIEISSNKITILSRNKLKQIVV